MIKLIMAEGEIKMKKESIYKDAVAICSCGETFETKSTMDKIHVEVCSKCHPFYTGKNSRTSKTGRVEKFNAKYGLNNDNK